MVKIRIELSVGELMIEFTNMADLENQLKNIDFPMVESLLEEKIKGRPEPKGPKNITLEDYKVTEELGTVNLLKISEGGHDATKLAIYLAANKVSHEDVKKITGVTILS